MLTTFSRSALHVKDSFIKSNVSWQISESGLTEWAKYILISTHLLSAVREYSRGMICCFGYVTEHRLAVGEERIMMAERKDRRQTKNQPLNWQSTLTVPAEDSYQCVHFWTCGTILPKRLKFRGLWSMCVCLTTLFCIQVWFINTPSQR